jgi:hypothetical protein
MIGQADGALRKAAAALPLGPQQTALVTPALSSLASLSSLPAHLSIHLSTPSHLIAAPLRSHKATVYLGGRLFFLFHFTAPRTPFRVALGASFHPHTAVYR